MADSTIGTSGITTLRPVTPATTTSTTSKAVVGKDFKSYLLESLEKVNQLQTEADEGVQKLVTGQTDNVAEVLTATRKAGIAFDLLMEIRNKLMDAYTELRQMRV
jgi:flagellar hook-basal body complex protein FliE